MTGRCLSLKELNLDHNRLRTLPMSVCQVTPSQEPSLRYALLSDCDRVSMLVLLINVCVVCVCDS